MQDICNFEEAKRWYESGQLEKIEEIEACVNNPRNMSKSERLKALRLITEGYLYRDKIGAAEKTFKNLLRADPLYEADSTDPNISYDLIYLSRTFSRRPIFLMYLGVGTNFSLIEKLQNYGVDNTAGIADHEGYLKDIVLGVNASLGFELPLIYNFDLALDLTFGYRTYSYGDSLYMSVNTLNPTGQVTATDIPSTTPLLYSILSFQENQFWLDLPLMLRYNIPLKTKGILPYIYAGAAANFLISANLSNIERATESEISGGGDIIQFVPEPAINITDDQNAHQESMRAMVNVSFVAGAGIKVRVGRNFIFADFRYTRMFLNNVDLNNRYTNNELMYRFGHIDNDFRTDNFALTLGFVKAFYTPRKKHQYNTDVLRNKYNKWLEKERNYVKKETDEDLKRELNSAIKEMQDKSPSLIEDVQKGRSKGDKAMADGKKTMDDIKNKRVKVEVKYD